MQSHNRRKYAVLKPAHNQFTESVALRVAAVKTADVGVPPRYTAHSHIKSCFDLLRQALKGGHDVAAPYERTVFLTAEICAAYECYRHFVAEFFKTVIRHFCIVIRVNKSDLIALAQVHNQVAEMLGVYFRLCLVKPQRVNAVVEIVLFQFAKNIVARLRIGNVNFRLRTVKVKHSVRAFGGANQHIIVAHIAIIFRVLIDGRPHRNNKFCTHFMQFVSHRRHVLPVFGCKLVVALFRPVKIVANDCRQGNILFLITPCNFKQIVLRFIAQTALPKSCRPVRHNRCVTC